MIKYELVRVSIDENQESRHVLACDIVNNIQKGVTKPPTYVHSRQANTSKWHTEQHTHAKGADETMNIPFYK